MTVGPAERSADEGPTARTVPPRSRRGLVRWALAAGAVAALALAPLVTPALVFVLTIALAKGLAALGVALLLRAGLISLGHAAYFATGAYAVAFLSAAGWRDYLTLLLVGTLAATVMGVVLGAFLARYRAIFFAMLNLAVSMVLYALLSKLYGITGGTDGIRVAVPSVFGHEMDKSTFDTLNYLTCIVAVVAVLLMASRYLKSPVGEALSAIHTNEIRLEYLGVSAWSVILTGYTLSAALAGLGGAFAVLTVGHALPEFAFWTESGHLVLTAVLGGTGAAVGPVIGSIFVEIVHVFAVDLAPEAWNLIMGAALLFVIFFLPRGLLSLGDVLRRRPADEVRKEPLQ